MKKSFTSSLLALGFLLCHLICVANLYSDSAEMELTLKQARKWALQHSFEMKKSRLDLEASKKRIRETVAMGLPQISATINYMDNLELPVVLIPDFFGGDLSKKIPVQFGTQHNVNASLQVNQLIFNGSYFVGLQTSRIFKKLAEHGLDQTRLSILETVSSTYYLALVTDESQSILSERLKNLKKTHNEIKENHREGFVEETDVDLIQISVTTLTNALQNLKRQKEIILKLLKFQMGLELDVPVKLKDNLTKILNQFDIPALLNAQFNLENNVGFQLVTTQEKLMQMALKNEKSMFLPTISAFYTYQTSAQRDKFNFFNFDEDWYRAQMLGINFMIPIFKSGGQRARVKQAAINWKKATETSQQTRRGLMLESERSRSQLKSSYQNYLNMKKNMDLAKKIYIKTLIKYKEGIASSMELNQAHDNYLKSQNQYIQGVSDLLTAKNKWDSLMGDFNLKKKEGNNEK